MKRQGLLFLAVSVALALTSLHLMSRLRDARGEVQSLEAQIAALEQREAQLTSLEASPAEAGPPLYAPPIEPQPPLREAPPLERREAAQAQPVRSASGPRIEAFADAMDRQKALLRDPEYRGAMLAQHKMMLARNYTDLAPELGLEVRQIDQLLTLLAEQQLNMSDNAPRFTTNDEGELTSVQERTEQLQREHEQALERLLGSRKYQEWQRYQRTMPARHEASELRSLLAARGIPLPVELGKPLTEALAEQQQRFMQESMQRTGNKNSFVTAMSAAEIQELQERSLERMERNYERIRHAVSHLLSAQQLEILEEQQRTQLDLQRAQLRATRAHAEAGGDAGTAPFAVFGVASGVTFSTSPPAAPED